MERIEVVDYPNENPTIYNKDFFDKLQDNIETAIEGADWMDLPLADGITQLSNSAQYNCKYKKIGKQVHIIGCVKGITANNTVIATLPAGYRPINTYRYVTGRNASNNAILSADTSGRITFVGLSNSGVIADSDYVYIQTSFFVS